MRVVLDANVFLSALLGGRTRAVLDALIACRFDLVTSKTLVEELVDVLSRPEWRRILGPTQIRDLLAVIHDAATFVSPTRHVTVCRDPDDNAVLDCALAGGVDAIVTGDKDLLSLHPFHGIAIRRPSDFLRALPS